MNKNSVSIALISIMATGLFAAAALNGCATKPASSKLRALKDAFSKDFLIGVAVNQAQFSEDDKRGASIVKTHFNSITPENVLKWESVHPRPDTYNFTAPDRYVEFGGKNGMVIIGHTLVWHNQTPRWVFEDARGNPVDRETLLQRMRDHIHTVVGRYKGRIKGWDVVNEAIADDGNFRATNQWYKIIGEDFIAKAFQFAHEADPTAELYYNDFALEEIVPKRDGVIALIKKLQARKIPIAGVGSQLHTRLDAPSIQAVDEHIRELARLGIKVNITELDLDVLPPARQYRGMNLTTNAEMNAALNPYANGLPDSVERTFTKRYADLFSVFLKHRQTIDRVTFWCVTDADSWLNYWPVTPRTAYPLLFDRDGQPKPAFDAVINTARP